MSDKDEKSDSYRVTAGELRQFIERLEVFIIILDGRRKVPSYW